MSVSALSPATSTRTRLCPLFTAVLQRLCCKTTGSDYTVPGVAASLLTPIFGSFLPSSVPHSSLRRGPPLFAAAAAAAAEVSLRSLATMATAPHGRSSTTTQTAATSSPSHHTGGAAMCLPVHQGHIQPAVSQKETAGGPPLAAQEAELRCRPTTRAPVEKRRLDYKPTDFLIDNVHLNFLLESDETLVTSVLTMRRREATPPADLRLDGEGLLLLELWVDGQPLQAGEASQDAVSGDYSDGSLWIPQSALPQEADRPFEVKTHVKICPRKNLKLSGLYLTNDLLCTQCEAEGFRRVTFFLDRPDVMALFTVRLEADAALFPVLLSNGNRVEEGIVKGSTQRRHFAVFEDPFKKPCYLFAVVAGQLASIHDSFVTKSGRKVRVEVFSEPSAADKLQWSLLSVKRAMKWEEETFGLEYDLDVFSIVCVRDFNMGAMENKSVNIFNASLLLADPKTTTDAEYERILGVIGHEYFHNWTGNRVTCRDWFQLTLKEGLTVFRDQLFSADMCSAAVKRIEDVLTLRCAQFPEDSGPMAHPIRPETYIAMDNFYTATVYEKGAEVVRMIHTLLGEEGFRRGMKLYFERHDGQAVTCDDFRAAMADANSRDLSQFERWYSQAGTPEVAVLTARYDSESQTFTLGLRQRTPLREQLPQVLPLKIGLIGRESKRDLLDPPTLVLDFTEQEQTFTIPNVQEPCVASLFREFSAPVKVVPWQTDEDMHFLMAHDSDFFNKWNAAQTLAARAVLTRCETALHCPHKEPPPLQVAYLQAFKKALLEPVDDNSIKALTLQLPPWDIVAQDLSPIDPEALQKALKSVRLDLVASCRTEMAELYRHLTLPQGAEETLDKEAISRRRLRNVLLRLLCAPGDEEAAATAFSQFVSAGCMTDKYAALVALADMKQPQREEALAAFFQAGKEDPVTVDKWFRVQAMADLPDVVEKVIGLQEHPAFNLKNPNCMRALLMAFTYNRPHFHRRDGVGYRLIADAVLKVDTFNSQAAARLATSFLQWSRFDASRQKLMQAQLERMEGAPGLSPDTLEIIQRALKRPAAEPSAATS